MLDTGTSQFDVDSQREKKFFVLLYSDTVVVYFECQHRQIAEIKSHLSRHWI